MKKALNISLLVLFSSACALANAETAVIQAWRFWQAPDHTRLVFDATQAPEYSVMKLSYPERLVIDFNNAKLGQALNQPPKNHKLFSGIRTSVKQNGSMRVVLDLNQTLEYKSFTLAPNKNKGHRLVVDLTEPLKTPQQGVTKKEDTTKHRIAKPQKSFIIAIDAGHGGEDPGAHGPRGTEEKTVVLAIAKKLQSLVNKKPGMKGVLIRKGDYYVPLRKRMEIARQARADLFISIHADAFKSAKVQGASVYTLSRRGASSEAARWLADQENAADLVGGVSLDDKDGVLASVLLDLSQTATKDHSYELANLVLRNIGHVGRLHKDSVQKAGFLVLKSPDIPSILVETAYISNPNEEQKLRNSWYQKKIAKAIYKGVVSYYQRHMPESVRMAATKHVISPGDTLSGIALQYGVSMKRLQAVNNLPDKQVRIGQVLSIPRT